MRYSTHLKHHKSDGKLKHVSCRCEGHISWHFTQEPDRATLTQSDLAGSCTSRVTTIAYDHPTSKVKTEQSSLIFQI